MAKQDDYVRYTIRVPSGLYHRLQEAAGEKSVNAEIVERLDQSFEVAIPLGPEFANRFIEASEAKRSEILRDLGDVLDKHFPDAVIELTPEQIWFSSLEAFSDVPEELQPTVRSQLLEMCRKLTGDPNWMPPEYDE